MSKPGLTKDMELVGRVGIGGILLFNVSKRALNGPIKFNSPKHHEMLKHVIAECEQPGLSFGVHNGDDWLSRGGQLIPQEQSVKWRIAMSIMRHYLPDNLQLFAQHRFLKMAMN